LYRAPAKKSPKSDGRKCAERTKKTDRAAFFTGDGAGKTQNPIDFSPDLYYSIVSTAAVVNIRCGREEISAGG
jgi:hypothetical protein